MALLVLARELSFALISLTILDLVIGLFRAPIAAKLSAKISIGLNTHRDRKKLQKLLLEKMLYVSLAYGLL